MSNLACRFAALIIIASAHSIAAVAQPAGSALIAPGGRGLDLAGADFEKRPGDDFFRYGNGLWYDHAIIPSDRSSIGISTLLSITAEARIREILEHGEEGVEPSAQPDAVKIGAFYAAYMNEARADVLDTQPIAPFIRMIRAAATREELVDLMGTANQSFFDSPALAVVESTAIPKTDAACHQAAALEVARREAAPAPQPHWFFNSSIASNRLFFQRRFKSEVSRCPTRRSSRCPRSSTMTRS
jgi:hypothetical protein